MISVVVPVYNEEESIRELHGELLGVLTAVGQPFEIIYVDDGSRDGTQGALTELRSARVISFTRNFGKSQALIAGFRAAAGDRIFTIDGDLQDDPKEIPAFLAEMARTNVDLISGWKQHRRDSFTKRVVSWLANALARRMTGTAVHDMNCGFKLYRAHAAKALDLSGDMHRYIPALLAAQGFMVGEMRVRHRDRRFGESKYGNLRRFFSSFFDFVTLLLIRRFLDRPMHFFGIIGTLSGLIGFVILARLTYDKLVLGQAIGNRPLLSLGVLLIVIGVQLFSSGFLGELMIRQSPERARYTVREDRSQS